MLGLNLHRPPFVVTDTTVGDFEGYSARIQDQARGHLKLCTEMITVVKSDRKLYSDISILGLLRLAETLLTSKNPNS